MIFFQKILAGLTASEFTGCNIYIRLNLISKPMRTCTSFQMAGNLRTRMIRAMGAMMGHSTLPAHNFDFQAWLRIGERPTDRMDFDVHPDYDNLPQCIKHVYSPREYSWLPNAVRDRLIESECYPEVEED